MRRQKRKWKFWGGGPLLLAHGNSWTVDRCHLVVYMAKYTTSWAVKYRYTTPISYTCTSTPLVVVIAHDIKIHKYTWNDTGSPKLDSPHMDVFIAPKATHPTLELIFRTK